MISESQAAIQGSKKALIEKSIRKNTKKGAEWESEKLGDTCSTKMGAALEGHN